MNTSNIKDIQKSLGEEYNFLTDNEFLGTNIILLGLGGSLAYGTNNENSNTDIREIATNSKRNILTGQYFEQVVDVPTDTTIYSLDRIVKLLMKSNLGSQLILLLPLLEFQNHLLKREKRLKKKSKQLISSFMLVH